MIKGTAGLGRKRPQLNIPIELIDLDPDNPRLARDKRSVTQFDLIQTLYDLFDIEELAYSMAVNGYFDEEPIVVIPQNIPKDFIYPNNIEDQQKKIQALVNERELRFTVVEGNRRVATLKLLLDEELRRKIKVTKDFPKPVSSQVRTDLTIIPSILYQKRDDISAYLGVRHIAGLLKWEAYAKAAFLAERIEDEIKRGQSIDESIKNVQRQTADRSDTIKKQYLSYKLLKTAEDDIGFDVTNIKNKFSLITVAINSPSIREFLGIESYREVDFSKRVVPLKNLEKLTLLLTWIYGNGKDKQPVLTDSRKITSRLAPILADPSATEYLINYETLEEAYERSGGEKDFLVRKLNDALKNLRNALTIAYKYKTSDINKLVEECIEAGDQLKKMLR